MINEQALKDRLQTLAKEKEIPFNACWKQLLHGLGDVAKELDLPESITVAIEAINSGIKPILE